VKPVEIPGLVTLGLMALFLLANWNRRLARIQRELQGTVERNQAACVEQIGQIGRAVEFLELSGQNIDDGIGRALNRSLRSQAMHLLASGLSPDSVASTLGVAKREIGLIAGVSKILKRE
jgi:hypothetical protein